MSCNFKLIELRLKRALVTADDLENRGQGGVLVIKNTVELSLPSDDDSDESPPLVRCTLTSAIAGKPKSAPDEQESEDKLFGLDVVHCGTFEIDAASINRMHADPEFRESVTEELVCVMQPVVRVFILSLLDSMGVKGVSMPWHLGYRYSLKGD